MVDITQSIHVLGAAPGYSLNPGDPLTLAAHAVIANFDGASGGPGIQAGGPTPSLSRDAFTPIRTRASRALGGTTP